MIRDSAPTQARVAFDGVGKENAGAHQAHNCYNRLDHRKRSFVPEAKRHLRHEKGWSTLGGGPIVRVVHCLTRWYGWRDNRSAGITAVYVSATERARPFAEEVRWSSPRRLSAVDRTWLVLC